MPAHKSDDLFWREAERENLTNFLDKLKNAEEEGRLYTAESFAHLLSYAIKHININAAELAREEDMSKASVSRWLSGQSIPPAPTRRQIVTRVKERAMQMLASF